VYFERGSCLTRIKLTRSGSGISLKSRDCGGRIR